MAFLLCCCWLLVFFCCDDRSDNVRTTDSFHKHAASQHKISHIISAFNSSLCAPFPSSRAWYHIHIHFFLSARNLPVPRRTQRTRPQTVTVSLRCHLTLRCKQLTQYVSNNIQSSCARPSAKQGINTFPPFSTHACTFFKKLASRHRFESRIVVA